MRAESEMFEAAMAMDDHNEVKATKAVNDSKRSRHKNRGRPRGEVDTRKAKDDHNNVGRCIISRSKNNSNEV